MRKKTKRLLIEFILAMIVLSTLTAWMIPKFMMAQNLNTTQFFPDPSFQRIVEELVGVRPGEKFTKSQVAEIEKLVLRRSTSIPIPDLPVLRFFRNLKVLDCRSLGLKRLDVSNNIYLTTLICDHNDLTELDLSHNPRLQYLNCGYNRIKTLDIESHLDLQRVLLSNNLLTEMPDLRNHKQLTAVDVEYNNLDTGDLDNITPLQDRFPGVWNVSGTNLKYGFLYSQQNSYNFTDCEKW